MLGDCRNAKSERGSTIFVAKYIAEVEAVFYMLESRNVRRCFLGHGDRHCNHSSEWGSSDERLVTGFYAFGFKIGVRYFGRHVDVATPECGVLGEDCLVTGAD